MDSKFNHEEGFSIPQETEYYQFEGCWIPATPEKPMPGRSNFMPLDRDGSQFGRTNWQELIGYAQDVNKKPMPNYFSQIDQVGGNGGHYIGNASFAGRNNHIAGPFTRAVLDASADLDVIDPLVNLNAAPVTPNRTLSRNISTASRPLIPNLHSPVHDWREASSLESLVANRNHCSSLNQLTCHDNLTHLHQYLHSQVGNSTEAKLQEFSAANQTLSSSPYQLSSQASSAQLHLYGFPEVCFPSYNLNSPPRTAADAAYSVDSTFQFPPVTPGQGKNWDNNQVSTVDPCLGRSSIEKNKQQNIVETVEHEATGHNFDELLHTVVDSSSAVVSTTLVEEKDSATKICEGIDLNKTPHLKPPKRKKHRPKVVVEGKPKRASKAATTKVIDSEEKSNGKKKHVRKDLKESATQHADSIAGDTEIATTNITNSSDKPTGERIYVHKNGLQESEMQYVDFNRETTNPSSENATAATTNLTQTKEKPTGKRKYARKDMKESSIQDAVAVGESTYSGAGAHGKSCRRALNFDLQNAQDEWQSNIVAQEQEMLNKEKEAYNLNMGFQAAELSNGFAMNYGTNSALWTNQQNSLQEGKRQSGAISNRAPSTNQSLITSTKFQTQNLEYNTKNKETRTLQHFWAEGIDPIFFPRKNSSESLNRIGHLISRSNLHPISTISSNSIEDRGFKRDHCHIEQTSSHIADSMGSPILRRRLFQTDHQQNCSIAGAECLETHKKLRVDDGMHTNMYGMPACCAAVTGSSQETKSAHDVHSIRFTSTHNRGTMVSCSGSKNINNSGIHKFTGDSYAHLMATGHNLSNQRFLSQSTSSLERKGDSSRPTQVCDTASISTIVNCQVLLPTPPKTGYISSDKQQNEGCDMDESRKQQTTESSLSNSVPTGKGWKLHEQDIWKDHKTPLAKKKARPRKQEFSDPIEEIIHLMEGLNLKGTRNGIVKKGHYALVPFKGNGVIVPYEGFEFIKKRKPRPKVDLDPETDRVWKLLMWKEESGGVEGTDKEKEEWWEEERRVFHGRADSFIARMHLVQGDRRFSKWKGSVVDSVIGVFLTQNVSDHLSSSAFMSLAARFPLKSMRNRDAVRISLESVPCISKPSNTIEWHKKLLRPSYYQSSLVPHKTTNHEGDSRTLWMERSKVESHRHILEEVLFSQDSLNFSKVQVNGGLRSSSSSNSEIEDPASGCKPNNIRVSSSTDFLQPLLLQEFHNHNSGSPLFLQGPWHGHQIPGVENEQQRERLEGLNCIKGCCTLNQQINCINPRMHVPAVPSHNQLHKTAEFELQVEDFNTYRQERISYWPSTASRIGEEKGASCMSKRVGQEAGNVEKVATPQHGTPRYLGTSILDPQVLLSQQSLLAQSNVQLYNGSQQHEKNKIFQPDSQIVTEPLDRLAESMAKSQNGFRQQISSTSKFTRKVSDVEESIILADKQTNSENKFAESNLKEQLHSTNKATMEATKDNLKARNRKNESEKKGAVDWESLRQQVERNGPKQRSSETMDSLDYEALRCASTKEISDTIKERGMNNLLAERIKEFLDRLVRDHGSVDLEWLRDVPPEKAKEYLLSIRGLGLKSVECVRLLTLHHLAFPVDTNVGRIAVRLGWVPLQPLPESLQLHLLELYPVLESIQKYLWPRLCKLDQRTLYELHYQLITFGKVFCTKSRPNCNACPMRAECRHFASAFASARLALPGPEEKSITTSTVPFKAQSNPGIVINPMPLPSLEDNILKRVGAVIGSCIPIVEEPATPEQDFTEVIESDIEDTFNEDPDEIPTIKLNIEEFSVNVQNYMQANMELQEGDMSKALVALNPGVASIPTPKLKNISRLRTEHQVYELPDSHPLLKRMDRREPDDPSPYLLAIWTPGETANSIQPSEQHCQSQGLNKFCNEETCFSCNSIREANSQTIRGTILIPCRTAMRGSFPLNGTYFQVNEVFADHESSINPIDVPRAWIWNLPRRIVYFGTSVSTIFKGLSTEGIQYCFWKGFVCVRGFDQKTRAPRPLMARLHFPASKLAKRKNEKTSQPGTSQKEDQ